MWRDYAWYDPRYSPHSHIDWRGSALAVQRGLGLWSIGNCRRDPARRDHPRPHWARLTNDHCTSVFFTSATSCLSVNGLARKAYCSWLGRVLVRGFLAGPRTKKNFTHSRRLAH